MQLNMGAVDRIRHVQGSLPSAGKHSWQMRVSLPAVFENSAKKSGSRLTMNHDAYHNSEQSEAPNEPTESCAFDHERNSLVVARGAGCIPVLDGAALM